MKPNTIDEVITELACVHHSTDTCGYTERMRPVLERYGNEWYDAGYIAGLQKAKSIFWDGYGEKAGEMILKIVEEINVKKT